MSPEEREEADKRRKWGKLNPKIICPHCQEKGGVRFWKDLAYKGKAQTRTAGEALTGMTFVRRWYCENCQMKWVD